MHGLENIRLHFDNGPSISKIFAPRKEKLSFPDNCDTCKLAIKATVIYARLRICSILLFAYIVVWCMWEKQEEQYDRG